ncbi:MAG: PQQ-binding-like beta-propeller repeat protein [Armatimonadota bacterium]
MRNWIWILAAALTAAVTCGSGAAEDPGRRLLAADYSTKRIAMLADDGSVAWEHPVRDIHDLHLLRNGNVLFQSSFTQLLEVDPRTGQKVWEYDAGRMNGNEGRKVEVHAFQRLRDGVTMVVESGPARILEVDRDGKVLKELKLKVENPNSHSDTRLARKLRSGNYLVAHERDGAVREYGPDGAVVWEYAVPLFGKEPRGGHGPEAWGNQVFAAVRLPNGNTLVSTGNGHSILEVTPDKQIVWSLNQNDLPGITLAWVTTLQVLPNGNIVFGNCHAGPQNPQIIEVTRDKKVVWSFKDLKLFGDALSNSMVLDQPRSIR